MKEGNYSLHSKFDIIKHKQTFINYLEVIIEEDGSVHYAIPSHQEYLINLCCKKFKMSRQEFYELCPDNMKYDFMVWLCKMSNAIALWCSHIEYYEINVLQYNTIDQLIANNLYYGPYPKNNGGRYYG